MRSFGRVEKENYYQTPKIVKVEIFKDQGCFYPWPFGKLYKGEDIYVRATLDKFDVGVNYNNAFQITFDYFGDCNATKLGTVDLAKPNFTAQNSVAKTLLYKISKSQINIPALGKESQTHYSMDVYWGDYQTPEDGNTFDQMAFSWKSGKKLGRTRHDKSSQTSDYCKGQQIVSQIACISPTVFLTVADNCLPPGSQELVEEYVTAGGIVYLKFNIGSALSENVLANPMSANWFMHSGHWAAVRMSGFDLGDAYTFSLA